MLLFALSSNIMSIQMEENIMDKLLIGIETQEDIGTLYFTDELQSCHEDEESMLDEIFGEGSHFVVQY